MHFEILVEDQSGKRALDILIPKIVGSDHTFTVHPYKGVGRIPRNMRDAKDPSKRILLENLPKLLKGYGRTFAGYPCGWLAAVVVVCDLDRRCLREFLQELRGVVNGCNPRPETRFCIAIEEAEAWFLGDLEAVTRAYPNAKVDVLQSYAQDSICGTWEKLADAVCSGGASSLRAKGWQAVGAEKSKWAIEISPHMDVPSNRSPSFSYFCQTLKSLIEIMG